MHTIENNFKWPGIKKQKCLRNYDKSIQRSKGKYGKIFWNIQNSINEQMKTPQKEGTNIYAPNGNYKTKEYNK